ncbi:MAG: hypothetical protein HOI70_11525 [Opitutae bacterium]|nr:hypothetical protein [Opitutae bacterium]
MKKLFVQTFIIAFTFYLLSCRSSKMTSIDFSDGTYKGEIGNKGKKNGKGFYVWHDGSTYEGDYKDDFRHGNGLFNWSNGESYKGDYLDDERTGLGIYRWPDGSFYEGSFLKGKRHGSGVYQSINGVIYDGEWFDDMQHGEGKLTNPNKTLVRGVWRNGNIITKPSVLPETASKPKLEKLEFRQSSQIPTTIRRIPDVKSVKTPSPLQNKFSNSPETIDKPSTEKITTDLQPMPSNEEVVLVQPSNLNIDATDPTLPNVKTPPLIPIKTKDTTQTITSNTNIWTGTVADAENQFVTDLIDGIDTVSDSKTKIPFTGKMQILDQSGSLIGEVNLVDGRLHGEEVFMDETGAITERNIWEKGVRKN